MERARPVVTHLTTSRWGGSYPRVAGWLRDGFRSIGRRYDIVFLEGPAGIEDDGSTRCVRLGRVGSVGALVPFARYLARTQPLLTLVKPPSLSIPAAAAGRVTGQRVVPWEPSFKRRETDTGPRWPRVYFPARRWSYRAAPALAAVSEDVADELRREFPTYDKPIITIPNPIDANDIQRRSVPHAERGRGLEFCAVGRLAEEKGYDILLSAFAKARPRLGRAWRLRIFGKGPRGQQLMALADRLGLAENVEFRGWVDNVYPSMASADVFVHAARFEPFGLVYAEALSLGVPVVATACPGGPVTILDGGRCGLLTPVDDDDALAAAIVRLAEDPPLRHQLAERGLDRVASFAPEVIAAKMADVADRLDGAASAPAQHHASLGDGS